MNKKSILTAILVFSSISITGVANAVSQDSISPTTHPEAFNISTCVKASHHTHDFSKSKWKGGTEWRFAMFEKLGRGFYAPNGKYVTANYNLYESTQGKVEAAKFVWESFNCKEHL
jgi:hypothetical protein